MNDYLTPRRRHSSLFQRMEDEIHKISRKLSAAKQHKDAHRTPTPTPLRQQSPGLTVRRHHQNPTPPPPSQELTRKWDTVLADRTNNSTLDPKRAPIRRLRFNHRVEQLQNLYPAGQLWEKENDLLWEKQEREEQRRRRQSAQAEKRALQEQLSQMRNICEEQSFKLGFLRAQNKEIAAQLEQERMESFRGQLYLGKLVEGYRIKIGKYKQILQQDETVEIDIRDL